MSKYITIEKLKIILILVFISLFFLTSIAYIFLREIPLLFSLFKNYFESGTSFFIPIIPNINILWFLPKEYQIIQLTIGQLMDLYIVMNILFYIDSGFYNYIKIIYFKQDDQTTSFLDFYIFNTQLSLINKSKKHDPILEFDNQSNLQNKFFTFKFDKKKSLVDRNEYFNIVIRIKKSILQLKELNLCLNDYLFFIRNFCYYFIFKIYAIFRLKNQFPPPNIDILSFSHGFFHWNGIDMKTFYKFSNFEMIFPTKLKIN